MGTIYGDSNKYVLRASIDDGKGYIRVDNLTFPIIFTQYELQKKEKVQLLETFYENTHISAFGKHLDILNISGHLLSLKGNNDKQSNIGNLLINKYKTLMRAYKVAKKEHPVLIYGPGNLLFSGLAIDLRVSLSSELSSVSSFSMTFVEKAEYYSESEMLSGLETAVPNNYSWGATP